MIHWVVPEGDLPNEREAVWNAGWTWGETHDAYSDDNLVPFPPRYQREFIDGFKAARAWVATDDTGRTP